MSGGQVLLALVASEEFWAWLREAPGLAVSVLVGAAIAWQNHLLDARLARLDDRVDTDYRALDARLDRLEAPRGFVNETGRVVRLVNDGGEGE